MSNQWAISGNGYFLRDGSKNGDLTPGIYEIRVTPQGEIYLQRTGDNFAFSYKIYGCERPFIDRVQKTYKATKGNLGILLNGVRGTGKTVTAKLLCNEFNLPVILVQENFGNQLNSFLNAIKTDIIVMFDEYEKTYKAEDGSEDKGTLLTLMDGILTSEHRKVFILTTNDLYVNKNLLQRPGRIRYLKTFDDLTLEVITEIVDDLLIYEEHRESTIKYLSMLETITIDIVKAVVEEVNIHNEPPDNFKDVFNTKFLGKKIDLLEIVVGENGKAKEEVIALSTRINYPKLRKSHIGKYLYYYDDEIGDHDSLGRIKEIIDETEVKCEISNGLDDEDNEIYTNKHYRIRESDSYHRSFQQYVL